MASYPECWIPLRATCRALRDRIDKQLYRHIIVANAGWDFLSPAGDDDTSEDGPYLILSPYGWLPGIGARLYPGAATVDQQDREHVEQLLRHTRILDVRGYLDREEWISKALDLDTVRRYCSNDEWDAQEDYPSARRACLSLIPTNTTESDMYVGRDHVMVPQAAEKVVSAVRFSLHAGPYVQLLNSDTIQDDLKGEVVFIFDDWCYAPSLNVVPTTGGLFHILGNPLPYAPEMTDTWLQLCKLAHNIAEVLMVQVDVTIVNIPELAVTVQGGDNSTLQSRFLAEVHSVLLMRASPANIAAMLERIRFLSTEEYDALVPGELELEKGNYPFWLVHTPTELTLRFGDDDGFGPFCQIDTLINAATQKCNALGLAFNDHLLP